MNEIQQKESVLNHFGVHGSLRRAMKASTVVPRTLSIWCVRDSNFFGSLRDLIEKHGDDRQVKAPPPPKPDSGGKPAAVKINKGARKDPTAAERMRRYRKRRGGQLSSLAARMRRAGYEGITAAHLETLWGIQKGQCWLSGIPLTTDGSDQHVSWIPARVDDKPSLALVCRWARAMWPGDKVVLAVRCQMILEHLEA